MLPGKVEEWVLGYNLHRWGFLWRLGEDWWRALGIKEAAELMRRMWLLQS